MIVYQLRTKLNLQQIMIEQEQLIQPHRQENNNTLIAIRPHFYYSNIQQANSILSQHIKKFQAEQDEVLIKNKNLKSQLPVVLKKKSIHKPLHLLKIRKRINKKTQQISYIIQQVNVIKAIYEYQDMCDFVSSEGVNIMKQQSKYSLDKNLLLDFVKEKLHSKINHQDDSKNQDQIYQKLIKPEYFLKSFNLNPPKCDFFVNKTKNKQQKPFNNSLNINFQQPIPALSVQIPIAIRESDLFAILQRYLAKRPCWLKNTLLFVLKQEGYSNFTINQLKNALKYLCYTFKNGPWKHTFCSFGFDPRKTYKSVIYQNVSLKLKKKEAEDYEQEIEQDIYDPTFNDISSRCMRAYQIGDIYLETVKQIINGKLISEETQCTKEHGWLSPNQHNHILKIMRQYKDKKNK